MSRSAIDFPETIPENPDKNNFYVRLNLLKKQGRFSKAEYLKSKSNDYSKLKKQLNKYNKYKFLEMRQLGKIKDVTKSAEKIEQYIDRQKLSEFPQDMIDDVIWQLKYSQKGRLFGYVEGNVFYAILIDMNHEMFPQ
ncbi:MAG: hypothetical protein ACR2NY_01945 [Alphaproteobacteria bacterium]